MTATNKPYCIDLYHLDAVVGANCEGFAQVKAQGIAFLDHKATQGTGAGDGSAQTSLECAYNSCEKSTLIVEKIN